MILSRVARIPVPRAALAVLVVAVVVTGGIAAYKACELLRLLTESRHQVRVVPTAAALRFVGEPTWAALSGQPVATDEWKAAHEVPHVRLGRDAADGAERVAAARIGSTFNFYRDGPRAALLRGRRPGPRSHSCTAVVVAVNQPARSMLWRASSTLRCP